MPANPTSVCAGVGCGKVTLRRKDETTHPAALRYSGRRAKAVHDHTLGGVCGPGELVLACPCCWQFAWAASHCGSGLGALAHLTAPRRNYASATMPLQNWFLPPKSTSYLRAKSSLPSAPIR